MSNSGRFDWELDCPELDRDHEILVEIIAGLQSALSAEDRNQRVRELMTQLGTYFESHFRQEETLMRESGFCGIAEHAAEHEQMRVRFAELRGMTDSGAVAAALKSLGVLRVWLRDHVSGTDRLVSEHLNRTGVRREPGC